jgi:hypothetical protein
MRIEVVPHEDIRPAIREWRRSLGHTREEQRRRFDEFWDEFVAHIVAESGFPKSAFNDDTTDPPTYWCVFPGGGLARLLVEPDERVGWFSYRRRVLVIELIFSPGLRGPVRP